MRLCARVSRMTSSEKLSDALVEKTRRLPLVVISILGSGWGGYRVLQDIDKRRYDVSLISPVRGGERRGCAD